MGRDEPGVLRVTWLVLGASLALAVGGAAQATPDPRAHHALAYHAGEGRVYLVGGSTRRDGAYVYFDDVWSWFDDGWSRGPPLPFPRSSHRVAYHARRASLILIGGGSGRAFADSVVWESGDGEWRAMGAVARAGRTEPEVCYDPRRDRLVVFGGWDADDAYAGDTWEWTGETLERTAVEGPAARAGHAFVFDPVRRTCLLFGGQGGGGYMSDTWEWDGVRWRRLDVGGPSARWFPAAAADRDARRLVLFGGRGPDVPGDGRGATRDFGDTWAWDGARWERLVDDGPSPRSGARAAYSGRGVLLFGGRSVVAGGFVDHGDTWELRAGIGWVRLR